MLEDVKIAGQIERRHAPTLAEFREYANVAGGKPLIITGAVAGSKALAWDEEYLKETVGKNQIKVYVSMTGLFPGGKGPHDKTKYRAITISVSECIERMNGTGGHPPIIGPTERYYVYQSPRDLYAEIENDLETPIYVANDGRRVDKNYWIGGSGNIAPAHYDNSENILVQLNGRKKILLWDPRQYDFLYVNALGTVEHRTSRVDLRKVDRAAFPKFENAHALEGTLEAGDILYIPTCWFHWVRSELFSISATYWWPLLPTEGGYFESEWRALMFQWALPVRRLRPELKAMCTDHVKQQVSRLFAFAR